jgi:peptidoglycan/xylan/chitin deacetylase (PgdA/CDA1 family)
LSAIAGNIGRGGDLTAGPADDRGGRLLRRIRGKLSFGAWLPVVRRLPVSAGVVGLSFDDGPVADATPALLDELRRYGATATFFVNGQRAAAAMEVLDRVVADGHDVLPHGWRHIPYGEAASATLIDDIEHCEALLRRLRPTPSPYLVRLPYGSGHMTARLHRALRRWNPATQIAYWEQPTHDWKLADGCADEEDLRRACSVAAKALAERHGLAGSIVVLHEQPFDVTAPLAARIASTLAPLLLDELSARGLRGTRLVPLERPAAIRRFIRG